jgi:hypothetical protein
LNAISTIALGHKMGANLKTGGGGLQNLAGCVAYDGWLVQSDLAVHAGWQLDEIALPS